MCYSNAYTSMDVEQQVRGKLQQALMPSKRTSYTDIPIGVVVDDGGTALIASAVTPEDCKAIRCAIRRSWMPYILDNRLYPLDVNLAGDVWGGD
jgi:hypothetical protein